jgi:cyclophilin family peptidyl-prolyl cis-trans isomerase
MSPNKKTHSSRRKSNKMIFFTIGIIAILLIGIGAYIMLGQSANPPTDTSPAPTPNSSSTPSLTIEPDPAYADATKVLLHTNMGDIIIALRNDMPITTGNFKNLVQQGTYNGTIFHRVISGFMIQGGDPTGTGYGDPSIPSIPDEFTSNNHNDRGTIAMANAGPNTGSSQFFINQVNNNYLDTKHPVFGKVISGLDVVDKIASVATDSYDRPFTNVTIIEASILP